MVDDRFNPKVGSCEASFWPVDEARLVIALALLLTLLDIARS